MCIICFLKDNYQYNLRKSSMLRTDRIEHTLDRYKYTFIDYFVNSLDEFCEIHNNETNRKINNVLKNVDTRKVLDFFDSLRSVYLNWINTQIGEAINNLDLLLQSYNLFDTGDSIQSEIFFRGRKSKDFISHWDMFHIPFNKRYLIQNQRYSINGQPILYLSSSPYCVIKELGTSEDIRISSFRVTEGTSFNVYENINKFNNIIVESMELNAKDSAEYMLNSSIIENDEKIISNFFQIILSSCCSFERREDTKKSSFSEEYVLPQVLTLVLKKHNFDGVKYISTKAHTDSDIINSPNSINVLYSNICLFANYTEEQSKEVRNVYDRELFGKFILSNPLKYSESISENFFSMEDWQENINTILNYKHITQYENDIMVNIGNLMMDIFYFKDKLCKDEDCRFKELLTSINLHSLLLSNIILNIKENRFKEIEGGFRNE